MTIATGGFAAPAALAWGGFAAGFSGTLINGGSFGQAVGMGLVGAFAGGVGGVAWGIGNSIARTAALVGIGATAGASGAAIMGGNIGLGALAGGAAGLIGGSIGPKISKWDPGIAKLGAGMATAAGAGAASAAIAGGSPGMGAGLGAFSVAAAVAAGKLQTAIDAARAKGGEPAVAEVSKAAFDPEGSKTHSQHVLRESGIEGSETQVKGSLAVSVPNTVADSIINNSLVAAGVPTLLFGLRYNLPWVAAAGGGMIVTGLARELYGWYSVPTTARTIAEGIWEGTGLRQHYDEIDAIR